MGPRRPKAPKSPDPAFAAFFDKCAGAVRSTLCRLRIHGRDLQDVEQDAWMAIFTALRNLEGTTPAKPESFASEIARRKALDYLRARFRRPEQLESPDDPEPEDPSPTPEERVMRSHEESQARAIVLRLLGELPVHERAVVVLADFDPKQSMREIAAELEITEEAARSRHRRAYERMRQSLGRRPPREAVALLPAVAALTLEQLLAIESPIPPLSAIDKARTWERVLLTLGSKALVAGGGAAAILLTAKQAAAGALLAFVLGGLANEAAHAAHTPAPAALTPEAMPAAIVRSSPPKSIATADPSVVLAATPGSSPSPTASPDGVEAEWQAIRDARSLLRRPRPSPEEALKALERVHDERLRDMRDQLREEAATIKRTRPFAGQSSP